MTEPGDKLERAYRGLAREEPSSALDAAILDASRRAVHRSSSSRWAVPLSLAAVLMLAVGVTMHMQEEEPGVETSLPSSAPPPAPAPQLKRDKLERQQPEKKPKVAPPPQKPAADAATRSYAEPATPPALSSPPPAVQSAPLAFPAQKNVAPAAGAPAIARQAAPPAAPPPSAPAGAAAARVAPAPASSADSVRSPEPATAGVAKRQAMPMARPQSLEQAAATPEQELERIARLRAEGRNDEADRALEEFRKRYPDYRIADAMWERVRPPPGAPSGAGIK